MGIHGNILRYCHTHNGCGKYVMYAAYKQKCIDNQDGWSPRMLKTKERKICKILA